MEELLLENDGLLKVNALLKQCVWLEEHSDMLMQQNKSLQPVNKEVREKNASVERSIKGMLAFLKGWAAKVGIKAPVFTSLPEDPIKEGEKSNDGDEGRDGCSNEECRIKNGDEEAKEHVENSARSYNIIGAEEREQKDNGEAKEHCDGDGEMGEPTDDEVLQRIRLVKELFLGKEPSVLRGNTFLVQYAVLKCKDDELDEQNEELWAERELLVKQMDLLKQQMDELSAFSKVLAAHSSRPIPDNLHLSKAPTIRSTMAADGSPNGVHEPSPKLQKLSPLLRVKKLSDNAVIPSRASPLSAGYDLSSAAESKVPARGKALVPTDLSIAIPEGTYARIAPRSGLAWKNSIDVGAGVIDADYRGPLGVILFNHSDVDFEVKPGDRIAQLIVEVIMTPDVAEVEDLDETVRGAGGFGSTGV